MHAHYSVVLKGVNIIIYPAAILVKCEVWIKV